MISAKKGVLTVVVIFLATVVGYYMQYSPTSGGRPKVSVEDKGLSASDKGTDGLERNATSSKNEPSKKGGFDGFQADAAGLPGSGYKAASGQYEIAVRKQVFSVTRKDNGAMSSEDAASMPDKDTPMQGPSMYVEARSTDYRNSSSMVIEMVGTDGAQRLVGETEVGDEPNATERWQNLIPRYAQVRAEQVYPGVDVVYYQEEGLFEFDYQIAPGVDASVIAFKVNGAESINKGVEGELLIDTGDNSSLLQMKPPLAYQWVDGVRKRVDSQYQLSGDEVRFEVGSYDSRLPLIIDPVIY